MKTFVKFMTLALIISAVFVECTVQTSENTSLRTLIIGPELKDCTNGAGQTKCMMIKDKPGDAWTYFYSSIQGFKYEPGYEYVLTVSTTKITNPPADASAIQYTLIRQLSKTKAVGY